MTWRIGDQGFEMTLSPKVGALIGEHLRPWLEGWLTRRARPSATSPPGRSTPGAKVLDAAEAALGLPGSATEDSREILADVRQHVVADGPVPHRPTPPTTGPAPLRCARPGLGSAVEAAMFA